MRGLIFYNDSKVKVTPRVQKLSLKVLLLTTSIDSINPIRLDHQLNKLWPPTHSTPFRLRGVVERGKFESADIYEARDFHLGLNF